MGSFSVVWMVLRRMLTQWRMELSLFIGLLAATGVVTAVPLYTSGALQKTFQQDWENFTNGGAPGSYSLSIDYSSNNLLESEMAKLNDAIQNKSDAEKKTAKRNFSAKMAQRVVETHEYLSQTVPSRLDVPLMVNGWSGILSEPLVLPGPANDPDDETYIDIYTMTGLEPLVRIEDGRLPSAKIASDGTVEVACPTKLADENNLIVGHVYSMDSLLIGFSQDDSLATPLKIRLVGTFDQRSDKQDSLAWISSADTNNCLYIHPEAFLLLIKTRHLNIAEFYESLIMDYQKVHLADLPRLMRTMHQLERDYTRFNEMVTVGDTPVDFFKDFNTKQDSLRMMMLALALPTLLLILYYVSLSAGLIVDQRRSEIAMIRSRGASTWQLAASTILEWMVLGIGCLLLGPPLGMAIAQLFGASAGFLNFVDRQPLPVFFTVESYLYAITIVLLMIVAATIPSIKAARHSIVSYKQERSRMQSKPVWQRFYLDVLLMGIGVYGYRTMSLQATAVSQAQGDFKRFVDPLLFIIPTLLTLAIGLVLLRLIPLMNRIFEKIFQHGKGVAFYTSLLETTRNPRRYRPLMLLVILTIATGIYGAAMARSLDQNTKDRIHYSIGADAVLEERWLREVERGKFAPFEPPFFNHSNMPGVISAARVMTDKKAQFGQGTSITVMAIDPVEFYHTAWFRRDLTPHHPHAYLNMLSKYPQGVIVSEQMIKENGLKPGDSITLTVNKANIEFVILGAVKYWPTLYEDQASFVIANLDYIIEQSTIYPYKVWLKLKSGAKLSSGLEYLRSKGTWVMGVADARGEIAVAQRDPQKMGFYGIISVGFCVAVLIMIIGFLLYTFISLQGRLLQFGVLRAIGLSLKQLVGMLCLEQMWTVGIGLFAGTFIGQAISMIFVPFLQSSAAFSESIPPFSIIISGVDIGTIYKMLIPVLVISLTILAFILARLQVHQAVKLGEEG